MRCRPEQPWPKLANAAHDAVARGGPPKRIAQSVHLSGGRGFRLDLPFEDADGPAKRLKPLAAYVRAAGVVGEVELERNVVALGEGAAHGILEHLIAKAARQFRNDHAGEASTCRRGRPAVAFERRSTS